MWAHVSSLADNNNNNVLSLPDNNNNNNMSSLPNNHNHHPSTTKEPSCWKEDFIKVNL